MNNLASALVGTLGERVALRDVSVSAALRELFAEVTVSQTYCNDEEVAIEAVYTFPLPLDALLLELRVEIGDRVLNGMVVEKKAAEEGYEDALAAGDAAVILEEIEPGLYTMNVGNLLPGEAATIVFSYAILYRWSDDRLRLFIPTTVAPRYGRSPHQPHQVPESSLTVENRFSLQVEVFGSLRDAQFDSPSHEVQLTRSDDRAVISLEQERAVMDRDFILNVRAAKAARDFALWGVDGDGAAALASFQPFFPGLQQAQPMQLAIVVDCSGSMAGDSIAQARQSLEGILDALRPDDRMTIVAFGSTTNRLWDRPQPCTPENVAAARRIAQSLDANMGGTEIGRGLRHAFDALPADEQADLLLVTDGEVADWPPVVREAERTGHRVFTVGVGRAVSEAFVRALATRTGGMCELVSPREGMAARVVRHFERMRAPKARRVTIQWPDGAHGIAPTDPPAVFAGDAVIAYARFDQTPTDGAVVLEVETMEGEVTRQEVRLGPPRPEATADGISTVARLAASARMKEMENGAALETALRYRLISEWTNWLVIAERPEDDKAEGIPAIRKVPQTMAAGWGGVGAELRVARLGTAMAPYSMMKCAPTHRQDFSHEASKEFEACASPPPQRRWYAALEEIAGAGSAGQNVGHLLDRLRAAGMPTEFEDLFLEAEHLGVTAQFVAAIILRELAGGRGRLPAHATPEALGRLGERAQRAATTISFLEALMALLTREKIDELAELLQHDLAHEAIEMSERLSEMAKRLAWIDQFLNEVRDRARRWRAMDRAQAT